ncbi:MAG: VanW family protein [Capsulimonadales bacterium]|nr:VanW family protein [Capsulimonadales bacterium]
MSHGTADTPNERSAISATPPGAGTVFLRVGVFGLLALLAVGGAVAYQRYRAYEDASLSDRLRVGVRVAGIDVGGKTHEEARQQVRPWAIRQLAVPVTFVAPKSARRWNITLAEIGGRYDLQEAIVRAAAVGRNATWWEKIRDGGKPVDQDFSPVFRFNEAALDRQLRRIGDAIYRKPVDARARISDSGQILLTRKETKGVSLDRAATGAALLRDGVDALKKGVSVTLVVREERPKVTAADLGRMGNVLASFTTSYSSSNGERSHNVELAAAKINGTMLAPGEEFSYNRIVGPREREFGWRSALMFQDGEVVPGVGGGVCQVASTLYNAVLRTDCKVTQRQNHSIKVQYVDPGRDATVVYGSLDFRFANTTDGPVMVLARTRNRRLTINLYGEKPKNKERIEIVSGPSRRNSLGGITVVTYRVVHHEDGKTTRQYLHTDSYRAAGVRSSRSRPARRRSLSPDRARRTGTADPARSA